MIETMTPEQFEALVEHEIYESNDTLSVLDAVMAICGREGFEPESAATMITANLKARLEDDGMRLNLLPKHSTVPLDF